MDKFQTQCKDCKASGWVTITVTAYRDDGVPYPEMDRELCDSCRGSGIRKNFFVFMDLDGVLVNFEKGVVEACGGKLPTELDSGDMWTMIGDTKDFYTNLEWHDDGKKLWEWFKSYKPVVITGLPLGTWAEPQKREWCRKNLGDDVEVICCLSEDKQNFIRDGYKSLLIDDRLSNCEAWKAAGGSAIHHEFFDKTVGLYFRNFIGGSCPDA